MKGREKLAHLLFHDSTSACARDQGGLKRKWGEALKEVLCNSEKVVTRLWWFDRLVVKWRMQLCFAFELGFNRLYV